MSKMNDKAVSLYCEKAKLTAITVAEVATMQEAVDFALSVCEKKEYCRLLLGGASGEVEYDKLPRATVKTLAGAGLPDDVYAMLEKGAQEKGFETINSGMRKRMAGIDVTLSIAEFGLADTASSCLTTRDEDKQLSTMICENHVIVLPKSKIFMNSDEAADLLQEMMEQDAAYTSFITGPSRTADIERVLALGVHGPLEMYVALLEA